MQHNAPKQHRWQVLPLTRQIYVRGPLQAVCLSTSGVCGTSMESMARKRHRGAGKGTKKAVNIVSGLKGATYEEKLEELEMLTLKQRRHQAAMVQVFKILHGQLPTDRRRVRTPPVVSICGVCTRIYICSV